LSWGLSGGPFYSSDIGGFYADERDPELYVRWAQATSFSAHLRFHGIGPREPWTYTPEAEAAVNEILTLRYRLLPYLWAVIKRSCDTGVPMQRAMVLAFPEDRLAWSFEHQFMCGDDLLVAPCIQAGGNIRFYLPEGSWTRFPSGEIYSGGRIYEETLALSETAVFARPNARIPLGPSLTHIPGDHPAITEYWNGNSK
ncbi:MAG: TIM-barrel domain-containing protein, partial [Pseudomonadota bacterium]